VSLQNLKQGITHLMKQEHFRYADTVEYDNGCIMRGNISVTADDGNIEL